MVESTFNSRIRELGQQYHALYKFSPDEREMARRGDLQEPKFQEMVECVTDELVRLGSGQFKQTTEAGMDAACVSRNVYDFHMRIRLYEGIIVSLIDRTKRAQQEVNAMSCEKPYPLTQQVTQAPSDIQIF